MDESAGSPCAHHRLHIQSGDFAQRRLPGSFGPLDPQPFARYAQQVEASAQTVSFRKAQRSRASHQIIRQDEAQRACVNGFGKVMWTG
jgi:hypothetical protein